MGSSPRCVIRVIAKTERRVNPALLSCAALVSLRDEREHEISRYRGYRVVLHSLRKLRGIVLAGLHSSPGVVRFGPFELDEAVGELRKGEAKIRLQELPFHVLQILLECPGKLVPREELQRRIWPSDTFVDFDHGINNAIKRLREALGDVAETPRYIETLPRRGYRFIGSVDTVSQPASGTIRSLAVLPLENLSGDPEQEYFADGLTESLITSLARIGALRVVSRTTAMHYKRVHRPLREIAQELQVDGIVEGAVLRSGDRVRISAQLIDARNDSHIWAESYERDLRDVLGLQAEATQAIARQVQVRLTPEEQARFARVQSVHPEAYEAYLKGRYHANQRSGEELAKAGQYFQAAIAKDPAYAAAYAGLADSLASFGTWCFVSPHEGCGKAKGLALRALEMEPGLAEAHASLAWINAWYDFEFAAAEREFERSLELNPRYPLAHYWFGFFLGLMGRYEEGYTEFKRAIRLDPLSAVIRWGLGFMYWCSRRYDEAIESLDKALELNPTFAAAHGVLGWAYLCKSLYEQAIAAGRKAAEISPGVPIFLFGLAEAHARAGHRDEAHRVLEQLRTLSKQRYVTPYGLARIYVALGEGDEALDLLETAHQERASWMIFLKTDPHLDCLRSDQRFQHLLCRMNFPEI